MSRIPPTCFLLAWAFLLPSLLLPRVARSQVVDTLQATRAPVQESSPSPEGGEQGVTPRGAFLRSLLVPGWGHAEVGSYVRGAFYFATQSTTALMLWKTDTRLARARDRRELMEALVRARLQAGGIVDPAELEAAVAGEEGVEGLTALEESRSEQREDWIALGIFLLFLGGADAYVSAHLADFPAAIEIEPTPAGGVEVGFSLPVGR